ncbi:hypothetical protein [Microbacterium sp.]|uniref:hypothetical protein n=1 Tax=Microbacterium sp. TaxID=51671 RepID=UPI002810BA75|nr:hypothetical protein [Microbacterium sp.]
MADQIDRSDEAAVASPSTVLFPSVSVDPDFHIPPRGRGVLRRAIRNLFPRTS